MKKYSLLLLFSILCDIVVLIPADDLCSQPLDPPAELVGKDGAKMVLIPAGDFQMGSNDSDAQPDEQPVHTVSVDAFYMDIHEVTVAQYKQFVQATGHHAPNWEAVAERSPRDEHPIIYVSWYDAMAYAQWAGKRLPTEAEWEKAARGGLVGKKYPWGNALPNGTQCNFAGEHNDGYQHTAPVRSYLPNNYGLYDMVGNVWEWCLDERDKDFYAISPRRNPVGGANSISQIVNNFTNIKTSRALRGGSWESTPRTGRTANRNGNRPADADFNIGFRCARSVTP